MCGGLFFIFLNRNVLLKESARLAYNVCGLGAVVSACAWENCAKPVLTAGTVNLARCLIGTLKKVFKILSDGNKKQQNKGTSL